MKKRHSVEGLKYHVVNNLHISYVKIAHQMVFLSCGISWAALQWLYSFVRKTGKDGLQVSNALV